MSPQQTIAHYRISAKLGEGGMGEVWKAEDTRLERVVALKILPVDKTSDPDRKRRFVQEAKSASALHHPHIVTIYDIGSDAGLDYIAMEYVAGTTLEKAIGARGVEFRQAIPWAIQISDALARAHAKGIVHRDVKPGNVMVDETGGVKVLDFGLSKLVEAPIGPDAGATVTMRQVAHTEEGKLVGTVAYMSPEQAEGRPVDARSDIFSFGALLYEMLTGRRPFTGDSKLSVLAAILREEPASISSISSTVPPDLVRIIARCLRKDPARRYQHMDDVRIALEDLKEESESGVLAAPAIRKNRSWPWIAATAAVVLSATAAILWLRPHAGASTTTGPSLKRLTFDSGLTTDPALSPDGRLIAYASDRAGEGSLDIWVQQLAGGDPTRITNGAEDECEPVFSPDGTHIAYRSDAKGGGIYVISALGGQPRLIAPEGRGPRYSPDGSLVAFWKGNPTSGTPYSKGSASIWVASAQGGEPRQIATDMAVAARPEWMADGRHLVFIAVPPNADAGPNRDFYVASPDGGASLRTGVWQAVRQAALRLSGRYPVLVRGPSNRYLLSTTSDDSVNLWSVTLAPPDWKPQNLRRLTSGTETEIQPSYAGNRVAFTEETDSHQVWSVPLDEDSAKIQGPPMQLTNGSLSGIPELSRDGKKLSYISTRPNEVRAVVRDLASGTESVVAAAKNVHFPTLSPDGSQLAYRIVDGPKADLFVAPSAGGSAQKLCDDCSTTLSWTNDSRQVLFKKGAGIALLDVPSGRQSPLLEHGKDQLWEPRFSPDGKWLAFLMVHTGDLHSIHIAPYHPSIKPEEWVTIARANTENDKPRWSPDGRLLYFTSTRDGYRCIWAQRLNADKRPAGDPFPVLHFRSTVRSMSNVTLYDESTSLAAGRLVLVLGERRGNIWTTSAP
jgi:serine/threonine protein kinase/Tol biopolymer transport system component